MRWLVPVFALAWCVPVLVAADLAPTNPDDLLRLAGDLLQSHPYLLEPEQKAAIDDGYRKAREAKDRIRRAKDDETRTREAERFKGLASQLLSLIEKHPKLVRLELKADRPVLPTVGPVDLPADQGALLLRIATGGDNAKAGAVSSTYDFSGQGTGAFVIAVTAQAEGTTYVLLGLSNVPKMRTAQRIDIKVGDKTWRVPLEVKTPQPGRLRLTVLADETGKPTPAMLRLTWKLNGATRRPSNAVEIKGQFDSQGRAADERQLQSPGRVRGEYYCIPGPLDMELPAGEWEVAVRRGVEHVAVFDEFKVEPGGVVTRSYRPRRWVDMRNLGWYSGDDHVHCQILSDDDAGRLMTYALAEDVHLVNIVKMGDIFRTWFEQRGFGPQYRIVEGDHVLCPGQECPRTHAEIGHTISMNIKQMIRDTDKYFLYDTVFDQVHADGGLTGYAHVSSGMFSVHRDMSINIPKKKVDFAEVLQFAQLGTDIWYRFLNAGFKVTASAGSDIPWGGTMGEVRVYAYVGDRPFSADAWFDGMRQGRTFVTNGPMLEFTVDGALPGEELQIREAGHKLRVKARVVGDPDRVLPAKLELVRHGEAVRTVEPTKEGQRELTIDTELDAGDGFWLAARASGNNGEWAHTTPVYVVRPGLRFWKHEDAGKLVKQAMTSLDEVEQIVANARKADSEGRIDDDRTLKQLAVQGPELLKRVADARKIWQDLLVTAEQESKVRAAARPAGENK